MLNSEYVKSLAVPVENQQQCLEAMAKYGENHWWEPGTSSRDLAYYQSHEPLLLIKNFGVFAAAVEELLGHGVWTHQYLDPQLHEEIDKAYRASR